jgi:hypothetical protein
MYRSKYAHTPEVYYTEAMFVKWQTFMELKFVPKVTKRCSRRMSEIVPNSLEFWHSNKFGLRAINMMCCSR